MRKMANHIPSFPIFLPIMLRVTLLARPPVLDQTSFQVRNHNYWLPPLTDVKQKDKCPVFLADLQTTLISEMTKCMHASYITNS